MLKQIDLTEISLGNEPFEAIGFETEEALEHALLPLMAEATSIDLSSE
tara:strand:- start:396 stop:539 length:144 start_codon:yes stop_codon:yes gene_type:complete